MGARHAYSQPRPRDVRRPPPAAPDDPVVETARILTEQGERDVAIQRVDGQLVIDGDIVVDERELERARVDRTARGGITALTARRWSGGVVPFVIDPALPNPQRVTDAIAHWEAVTPVRFVARTSQSDFVRFAAGTGCSSAVGRQGGAQTITLDTTCGRGATIHEIGHAVGSWHEQSRTDRDAYVTVHAECIQSGREHNFSKFSDGANVGPYDYRSIMHYSRFAFSNGCETLTPTYPNTNIGQQGGLSAGDVLTVHRILNGWRPGVDLVHADYDGDGRADVAIKDDTGAWRVDYSNNGLGAFDLNALQYGFGDANPVPADYDGDGKADLAIKGNDGAWFIDYSGDTYDGWDVMLYGYGGTDAVPVPADYDGDGRDDIAVKSTAGYWHIDYAANGFGGWNLIVGGYGGADAVPVPADYDGDGKADLAVKSTAGYWHVDYANGGFGAWNVIVGGYGGADAVPLPADYDGDGKADLSVKNGAGTWHIDYANGGFGAWNVVVGGYGGTWVTPVPADYDGDGKVDLAVKELGQAGAVLVDYAAGGFGAWQYTLPLGV